VSTSPEHDLEPATVAHIARLARLEIAPEAAERLRRDLGAILGHIEQLTGLDTTGVPPTTLSGEATRLRPEGLRVALAPGEHVANAPDHEDAAFRVPRVL
jgi:aspartyl-tRNA(Asn)/glutamyl-tRNA(Gln) amidotransferase subunit C